MRGQRLLALFAVAIQPLYAVPATLLVGALAIRIVATFRHTRPMRERVPSMP